MNKSRNPNISNLREVNHQVRDKVIIPSRDSLKKWSWLINKSPVMLKPKYNDKLSNKKSLIKKNRI